MKNTVTPKNDKIFKLLYGTPQHQDLLCDLLESIVQEPIGEMKVIPEKLFMGEYLDSKDVRNDIFVETEDKMMLLEMQRKWHPGLDKRMEIYSSRALAEYLKIKGKYKNVKKIIVICILDFHYQCLTQVINKTVRTIEPERKVDICNTIEFYMIDLPIFRKQTLDLQSPLHQNLVFIDYQREELIHMLAEKEERVRRAVKEFNKLKEDEEVRKYIYDLETAQILRNFDEISWKEYGRAEGEKKGRKEGRAQEKSNIVNNMLQAGIEDAIIKKVIGISQKELDKRKAHMHVESAL